MYLQNRARSKNATAPEGVIDLTEPLRQVLALAPGCTPSSTVADRLRALGIDLAEAEQIAARLIIERLRARA